MNSSTDAAVVRGVPADAIHAAMLTTELRTGTWTRLGDNSVLGDSVTESALHALAESTRASAQAQGYAVGWSQGHQAAEESSRAAIAASAERRTKDDARRDVEHQVAVAALQAAAEQLTATTAQVCASVETQAVDIAMQLTEALIGRELEVAMDPGADAVRRVLSLLPAEPMMTVRLHPDDVPSLAVTDLVRAGVRVVADPALTRGDAIAQADDYVIDASVANGLERVREVLAACHR